MRLYYSNALVGSDAPLEKFKLNRSFVVCLFGAGAVTGLRKIQNRWRSPATI